LDALGNALGTEAPHETRAPRRYALSRGMLVSRFDRSLWNYQLEYEKEYLDAVSKHATPIDDSIKMVADRHDVQHHG
jgi:hypothetical protein